MKVISSNKYNFNMGCEIWVRDFWAPAVWAPAVSIECWWKLDGWKNHNL